MPQFQGSTKCAPRASAKIKGGGRPKKELNTNQSSVENETLNTKEVSEKKSKADELILPDNNAPEVQQFMSDEDVVMNVEIEYGSGVKKQGTQAPEVGLHTNEFDISIIEELDDDAEQWPEAVSIIFIFDYIYEFEFFSIKQDGKLK